MTSPGYLTKDELIALWKSVTDESYWRPLVENEDSLIEAIEQAAVQYERVSQTINELFEAFYVLPSSGQTALPATIGRFADVTLKFTRTGRLDIPLVVFAGFIVEQELDDFSPTGPIAVRTGRSYITDQLVVMMPGDTEFLAHAVAEKQGAGYNGALVDTIVGFDELSELSNGFASVTPGVVGHVLTCSQLPDVIPPTAVGSYVQFIGGANVGRLVRILGYSPPVPGVSGPVISLAAEALLSLSGVVGSFVLGETVTQAGGSGVVIGSSPEYLYVSRTSGDFASGAIVGGTSGATATVEVRQSAGLVAETNTAEWSVVSWRQVFGLQVTNPEKPSGGTYPWLEEWGSERGVSYSDGESEESYRSRVAKLPDTVSPNAIVRAANSVLAPLGFGVCFREVGTDLLPGLFYDAGSSADSPPNPRRNFAYDMDFDIRPEDRFKIVLSIATSRAYFMIGVPGFTPVWSASAYDEGPPDRTAYDVSALFDGGPLVVDLSQLYRAVYAEVLRTRVAGVSFDLYVENVGCF
jgi:hypothetical protein